MSLIADALKKAQSARLGRRYLAPDATGVLPKEGKGDGGGLGRRSLSSILSGSQVSPALLVGLASGVFLFVALLSYFFYARAPRGRAPAVASSGTQEKRPTGLILTPPPSVPSVEPLVLEKEGPQAGTLKPTAPEGTARANQETPGKREGSRTEVAKVEGRPRPSARGGKAEKKSGSPKVAVTPELSEEVRYHFNIALSYQEERNFSQARREYEKVVQLWPLYAEAHNNLGVVYKELGMYDQAIAEFNKAVALNPRYPRAYHNLGVIYQMRKEWKQATKNYETALSLDHNHLASYNNLGLVYRAEGRLNEAREVLEKALAIDPRFPQTHYNLALVLEELGEVEQARYQYQKFVENAGEENGQLADKVRAYLKEHLVRNTPASSAGSQSRQAER